MAKSDKYAIGVDLGGTFVKFGLVTHKGKIITKLALESKSEKGPDAVVSQIKKGIKELLCKKGFEVQGIGIGAPGVVSIKKGTVENPPNFPEWGKVHLGKIIHKEFKIPVYVENDANAAAIGEMIFGAGKKANSFIMVTLGTGVGGGIIFDRKLFRGDTGGAGEVGHISIDFNGVNCNCGSIGCVEAYAGNNYLVKSVIAEYEQNKNSLVFSSIDNNLDFLTPKIISDAAAQGDAFAIKVVEQLGKHVGYALASASNLLDVSTMIVGGGVAGFGEPLLNSIESAMKERVIKSLQTRVKVIPAKLKNEAGIKGASALVFY